MAEHLKLSSVTVEFRLGQERLTALKDVSLSLAPGEFGAIIGPSGCGKSTLLRVVADIIQPTHGTISIGDQPPAQIRLNQLIGFVFQDATLLPWRNVIDNIRLPLIILRDSNRQMERSPQQLVDLVGLTGFEKAMPSQLSGGMQQRVAIARALVLNPQVLLLDEPFGALDEITRQRMNLELLRIWAESQTSALLVTHSIAEAVFMADRVFVLTAGPGQVKAEKHVPLTRPRTLDMMRSQPFFETVNFVRDALYSDELPAESSSPPG